MRKRARAALLTEAIAKEEKLEEASESLLTMDGMDDATAHLLASKGVSTMEDLADLAVDELMEMANMDAERAKQLITTAHLLASKGISTMEDLADLAVDELMEMAGMDAERAKQLIMTARAPWFA